MKPSLKELLERERDKLAALDTQWTADESKVDYQIQFQIGFNAALALLLPVVEASEPYKEVPVIKKISVQAAWPSVELAAAPIEYSGLLEYPVRDALAALRERLTKGRP